MESQTNGYDLMIALIQQFNICSSDEADEVVKAYQKLINAINQH